MKANPLRSQVRRSLITALDSVTAGTRLQKLVDVRYGGVGCVLMWHSVVADPRESLLQDIRCSVTHLQNTISWALSNGVAIVDLAEAFVRLRERRPGRFLVLTFDDGYRDNLMLALPVCTQFDVPMTVYVVKGLVRRESFYWWGALVELVRSNDSIDVPAADRRFRSRTFSQKTRTLHAITQWVQGDIENRVDELVAVFRRYDIDWRPVADRDILNVDELRELADHPLVTVGSHSASHRILSPMPIAEARSEIEDSKLWLEATVDRSVVHFAYPHGDQRSCTAREARLVREAGYQTAVSSRRGNLFPVHAEAPFMLPRGAVNPNRESVSSITAQTTGLPRLVTSRIGPPVDPDTIAVYV